MLVQLTGVSKSFGSQDILRDATFQINPSERIGLIGANGAGKTTLLKLIAGAYEPDSGSVSRRSQLEIGSLDQIPDFRGDTSVLEEALRASAHLQRIETNLRELEHVIADAPAPDVLDRYSEFQLSCPHGSRAARRRLLQRHIRAAQPQFIGRREEPSGAGKASSVECRITPAG